MSNYQPLIPTGLVDLDQDYQNIQGNFQQLDTSFGVDHLPFSNNTAQNGYHTVAHLLTQSSVPSTTSAAGQIFVKASTVPASGDPQLFYTTPAGGVSQISGSSGSTNGFGWFSGILFQWGTQTISGSTTTFPVAFPNNCFNVQTTLIGSSVSTNIVSVVSKSKTGFTWNFTGTISYTSFFWMAVGN